MYRDSSQDGEQGDNERDLFATRVSFSATNPKFWSKGRTAVVTTPRIGHRILHFLLR